MRRPCSTLLGEELARLGDPAFHRLLRNILQNGGNAAQGALIGDAGAHDAGADDGRRAHRRGGLGVLLADFLQRLLIDEDGDQRAGGLRARRFGELLRLQGERGVAIERGAGFQEIDRVMGGGVMRQGLRRVRPCAL